MERVYNRFEGFIRQNNLKFLAISLGLVYIWFGALKFFPGLSPAEQLAAETIGVMTFGLIPDQVSLILLAVWEVAVGVLFISGRYRKLTVWLMLLHMLCSDLFIYAWRSLILLRANYCEQLSSIPITR